MTVYALGKFGSLHRGHRALIEAAAALGTPGLLHFQRMAPVLGWPPRPPLLTAAAFDQVVAEWATATGRPIRNLGLDFALVRDDAPAAFVDRLCHEHGATGFVCGDNFRFGRDRAGSAADLIHLAEERGLVGRIIPAVAHAGAVVSSSRVRDALQQGAVALAAELLERPYRMRGRIVAGDGRGRRLGFPTANLIDIATLIPATGVYAAWAQLDGDTARHPAAVNIGHLPTIADGRAQSVEAHLLDYQGQCYDQDLELAFVDRLRPERRFDSLAELQKQIANDIETVRLTLSPQ